MKTPKSKAKEFTINLNISGQDYRLRDIITNAEFEQKLSIIKEDEKGEETNTNKL